MEALNVVFPIIMYILGSILLVVLIILVLKLIYTVDKTNEILDDVDRKIKTLDGLFNAIDTTSATLNAIGDRLVDGIFNLIGRFTKKKNREEEEGYE